MPMVYETWERRDDADPRDWGLAALQWCRVNRARDEVVDARYWICRGTRLAVLIELEPGADPMAVPESKEWAQALGALVGIASNPDREIWNDAQVGADVIALGS